MKSKPITIDELPDIQRETLEIARDNIAAMEQAIKPTFAQEVKRIWIAKLGLRGVSAEQALKLLEAVPEIKAAMTRRARIQVRAQREFLRAVGISARD